MKWIMVAMCCVFLIGCAPQPNGAILKKGTKFSDGSMQTGGQTDVTDLRAVRVYVHHDGKWMELDPDDIVKLEWITADALILDPPTLVFSVGGPKSPSDVDKVVTVKIRNRSK